MNITRTLAGVSATVMLAAGLTVATAPAASAVDIDIFVSCSQAYSEDVQVIEAQPGDRIVIEFGINGLCDNGLYYVNATTSDGFEGIFESGYPNGEDGKTPDLPGPPYIWEIKSNVAGVFGGPDDSVLQVFTANSCGVNNNTSCGQEYYLFIGDTIAGSPQGSEGPPVWNQSYARANQDEECAAGWSPSWDFWPNGGTGGWVCNRTVPATGSTP